ncbi:MAG: SIMPL domain-containing protein [Giesbergeria sp.]
MTAVRSLLAAAALLVAASSTSYAQSALAPAAQNVLQLQASGTVEVQQDVLVLTLSTLKEGKDAAVVQSQLRQALDTALTEVRKTAEAQKMDVRTGNFSLSPRYDNNQRINGWQGRAELVLEGHDFPRITGAAARVNTLTISQVAFDLSRSQRQSVERDAQQQAIVRFKEQATALSTSFGFGGYGLREISVQSSDSSSGPRPRMMAMEAKGSSLSSAPLPVEPGLASVTVTVSGSVQMR